MPSDLLDEMPFDEKDLEPDEKLLLALTVAVGMLAMRNRRQDLANAVEHRLVLWATEKGLIVPPDTKPTET